MSNRHMTWWHNAWWVRVNNGPHLRDGTRPSKSVASSHQSCAGSARHGKGRRGRKGEMERREAKKATQATRCTSYSTYPNSNSDKHDRRSSNSSSTRSNATVPVMLFNKACHRNVDLEHPMYYNETNDGWDDSSGSDNFLIDSVLGVVRMETEGCDCLKEEAD